MTWLGRLLLPSCRIADRRKKETEIKLEKMECALEENRAASQDVLSRARLLNELLERSARSKHHAE